MLVDVQQESIYWCYPKHQIQAKSDDQWQRQKTVTSSIPRENHFGSKVDRIPKSMMEIIDAFGAPVGNVLKQLDTLADELASESSRLALALQTKLEEAGALLWGLTRATRRIQQGTVQQIKNERTASEELLWQLDYTPGSASDRFLRSGETVAITRAQ
jgi:hypothetical protein